MQSNIVIKICRIGFFKTDLFKNGGIVDQQIDLSKCLKRRVNQLAIIKVFAQVSLKKHAPTTGVFDFFFCFLCGFDGGIKVKRNVIT